MTHMTKKIAVVLFPGSNCDQDCIHVFKKYFNLDLIPVWHKETNLPKVGGLILPGGFSYGDYLRAGSLASNSPIMSSIVEHAKKGGAILGICNGFQILTESNLLPGTLLGNSNNQFICESSQLTLNVGDHLYHSLLKNRSISMPIAHAEGRYYIDTEGLKRLKDQGQIVLRYDKNPNGSVDNIAGVCSFGGRVVGLMPHPERAVSTVLQPSIDGLNFIHVFLSSFV